MEGLLSTRPTPSRLLNFPFKLLGSAAAFGQAFKSLYYKPNNFVKHSARARTIDYFAFLDFPSSSLFLVVPFFLISLCQFGLKLRLCFFLYIFIFRLEGCGNDLDFTLSVKLKDAKALEKSHGKKTNGEKS